MLWSPLSSFRTLNILPDREKLTTLKITFVTIVITLGSIILGGNILQGAIFLSLTIIGSFIGSLTWLNPEARDKIARLALKYPFWLDFGFSCIGVYLGFTLGPTTGLGFFFTGLFLTIGLRWLGHMKGTF